MCCNLVLFWNHQGHCVLNCIFKFTKWINMICFGHPLLLSRRFRMHQWQQYLVIQIDSYQWTYNYLEYVLYFAHSENVDSKLWFVDGRNYRPNNANPRFQEQMFYMPGVVYFSVRPQYAQDFQGSTRLVFFFFLRVRIFFKICSLSWFW